MSKESRLRDRRSENYLKSPRCVVGLLETLELIAFGKTPHDYGYEEEEKEK